MWIKISKGEFLISQRSENRPTYPLMLECVGGSVIKGESSLEGAIREVKEEVGIDLTHIKGELVYSKVRKEKYGKKINDIVDAWLFSYDGKVDLKEATTDEVRDFKWMTK